MACMQASLCVHRHIARRCRAGKVSTGSTASKMAQGQRWQLQAAHQSWLGTRLPAGADGRPAAHPQRCCCGRSARSAWAASWGPCAARAASSPNARSSSARGCLGSAPAGQQGCLVHSIDCQADQAAPSIRATGRRQQCRSLKRQQKFQPAASRLTDWPTRGSSFKYPLLSRKPSACMASTMATDWRGVITGDRWANHSLCTGRDGTCSREEGPPRLRDAWEGGRARVGCKSLQRC